MLDALLRQVNKDFRGIESRVFETDFDLDWNAMMERLEPIIDRLINLDSERFFRLLYTIDIDERKVKQILFGSHEERTSWSLSVLILERELLKVVTKKHFSRSIE
jgi:hypothetical protein